MSDRRRWIEPCFHNGVFEMDYCCFPQKPKRSFDFEDCLSDTKINNFQIASILLLNESE